MASQQQSKEAEFKHWVKARLGLIYLKEGLAPFCQGIANQQRKHILDNIRQTKSLASNATCGTCQYKTLKPNHNCTGSEECPYGLFDCNCRYPRGKYACPNGICGAIYDDIIRNHRFTPNWENTDSRLWTSDPWSIAKCFINGYDLNTSAAGTDCIGLLHMIRNNRYFQNHISSNLTGTSNVFKVSCVLNKFSKLLTS